MVLFFHPSVWGQSYSFKHYQVENGLSNNAVICSLQDKRGFLWFGTKDGLNRFDGYTFKVFRHNPDEHGSIGNNFIESLYEDGSGTLWIGTEKGLYKFDALSERFEVVPAAANLQISELAVDSQGNIWFINGFTLYRYAQKSGTLATYNPQDYFEATGICTTPGGTVWLSTSNGFLQRFNAATNSFTPFDVFPKTRAGSKWIEKIQNVNDSAILVGTSNAGLKIFSTKTNATRDIDLQQGHKTDLFVRSFLQTAPDETWIGTESGVFVYNNRTGKAINLGKKYNDPFSLSDNAVYTFCHDKEGGVWIGTYFGGLNYYPRQFTPFKKYFPKIGENSLSGNVVREIRKDSAGNLWIGTEDAGLNKLDANGRFTHYLPAGTRGSLCYSNIHGLLLRGHELWIGTFEHGLDVMDTRSGKVVRHYGIGNGSALHSNFIYTIYQTAEGDILLGTTIGLYQYNRVKNDFDAVAGMPLYNWYTSIVKDASGVIWTGTYGNGINFLDTRTGRSGNLQYNAADKNSLSSNRVNAIFEDREKNLWFATEDGLCKWNPAAKNFKRYSTANGFPSNFMMSILEDEKKRLWISTTKGLVCFNPASEMLKIFTTANGLLSDQLNFSSAYKDADGRMYFGSAKGLVSFQPAEFSQTTFTPPVYITGFQVNNKEMEIAPSSALKAAIPFTEHLTLSHNQSTFSIDFAALSYTAPEMLEYAYKMDGLPGGWTYLKKNRKVYFTELAAGTYTFRLKATNSSGIWNNKETKLSITILPPWWTSWWAYSLYALLLLLLIAYIVRSYHNRMHEKAARNIELLEIAKEKEIYHAKMEFFTNVAHEIRTPLTLIKGPLEKVIRKAGGIPDLQTSLRIMDRNTNRLIELTNELLDFRQTEINGFSLSFVNANISELLDDVYQSFTSLAEQKNLQFALQLPPEAVEAYVDVEAFSKIIYNLFSNAVKYAESRVVIALLPAQKSDTSFSIQVKNDGFLIPVELKEKIFEPFYRIKETEKQKGTGIGLALSRSLAQLHKGELTLEAPSNGMNIFTLTLPLHQEIEFTLSNQHKQQNSVTETNFKA
ncbi:MAG TPA: two-component regulator propeller domain-containing protein [Flavisolibacter sp.]|nr:two-component regulator propeller domain-containing protein [Flavisolibacter sp.]